MIDSHPYFSRLFEHVRRDAEYASACAEPKIAVRALRQRVNVEEQLREERVSEMLTIEARQTCVAGNPSEPVPGLENVVDDIGAQSIFGGECGASINTRRRLRIERERGPGRGRQQSQG